MASPTEVTPERITETLTKKDVIWQQDPDDKNILVPFVNVMFVIQLNSGGIMSVHGMWRGDLKDLDDQQKATEYVQDCNSRTLVPKIYLDQDSSDTWKIHTESNIVVPAGLTDQQLEVFLELSFQSSLYILNQFEQGHPHLVTWTEDGQEKDATQAPTTSEEN